MISHLLRCASIRSPRFACDCGADAQNDLARRLDALPPIAPILPSATPLRAVARMLGRLAASATHHDAARHLLATARDEVELAAGLSPEEAVRALDAVEPSAEDDANDSTQ